MKTKRFTFGRLCAAFAMLLAFAVPARAAFHHRCNLTVAGIPSGTTLTNFPVLVRLDNVTGFAFNQILTAGASDLSFADADENPLAWEVDTFDASGGKLLVWVKLPSATTNTTFKAYWGAAHPPAHTASAVWSAFKGVWHLNGLNDSTANGYNLTTYTNATTLNADGKLGACYTIAPWNSPAKAMGPHGLVALGTTNATLGTAFTVSGWLRHHGGYYFWDHVFYRKKGSQDTTGGFSSEFETTATKLNAYGAGKTQLQVDPSIAEDTWIHIALTFSGTTARFYANGISAGVKIAMNAPTDNGLPLVFGNNWNGAAPDNCFWRGEMDELRVYPATASAGWMAAEYNTMANAGFLIYGTKEDIPPEATVIMVR